MSCHEVQMSDHRNGVECLTYMTMADIQRFGAVTMGTGKGALEFGGTATIGPNHMAIQARAEIPCGTSNLIS